MLDRFAQLRCEGLPPVPIYTLSQNTTWTAMRKNLQQHVRLFTDESWPETSRTGRLASLWDEFHVGVGIVHYNRAVDLLWPRLAGSRCDHFACAACPIGEITVRVFALLCLDRATIEFFFSPGDRSASQVDLNPNDRLQLTIWSALSWADQLVFSSDIAWQDIADSGWPLFAVLAGFASHVFGSKLHVGDGHASADAEQQLRFDLRRWLRPRSLEDELLSNFASWNAATNVVAEPMAEARERWIQLTFAPGHSACLGPNLVAFALLLDHHRFSLSDVSGDLELFRSGLSKCRLSTLGFDDFLAMPWPLFDVLDRLQLVPEVSVRISPSPLSFFSGWRGGAAAQAQLLVPRTRRPGTYGFVGDFVRATRQPHCSVEFQNVMDLLLKTLPPRSPIHIVDVGGMLGDCCLWSLQRALVVRRGGASRQGRARGAHAAAVRCTVLESNAFWASLAGQTSELNADRFGTSLSVWPYAAASSGHCTLDRLLLQTDRGDLAQSCGGSDSSAILSPALRRREALVLKVHTDGRELDLLQGAMSLLRSRRLLAAVVRSSTEEEFVSGLLRGGVQGLQAWLTSERLAELYVVRPAGQEAVLIPRAARTRSQRYAARALLRCGGASSGGDSGASKEAGDDLQRRGCSLARRFFLQKRWLRPGQQNSVHHD
mmetsp:Transcript_110953/g.353486  ORF Transcript_110953/g.353486 Transcript_110953/m.353486 type:complete len:658 (-) Transcript_110953:135-2108(-)